MKRAAATVLLVTALVAGSGCGSSKSASGTGLGTALSYVPKSAPLVFVLDTDPNGAQWKQVDKLLAKFPGSGQLKQQVNQALSARYGLDWDGDVKPLLGNDLVIALSAAPPRNGPTRALLAWKVKDEAALKRLLQKHPEPRKTYAIDNGTFVFAPTKPELDAAISRAKGSDHMTEQDFTAALGNLDENSLLRVTGNMQTLIGNQPAAARRIPWVAALRTFGAALKADPDGIGWAFDVKTDAGTLTTRDLPLAAGRNASPVIRAANEVGIGLRDPSQTIAFAQMAARVADPAGYAKYARNKAKAAKKYGVNIDRDVFGQLTGNAQIEVSLNGQSAIRADLRDPAAAVATLKKIAPTLATKANGEKLASPKNGKGFYVLTKANGNTLVFGVVGKSFVFAPDAAQAAQLAGESPTTVSGAKGSLVMAADARSIVDAAAAQRGQGVAAQLLTSALGDVIGSMETETSGVTGSFKLFVR